MNDFEYQLFLAKKGLFKKTFQLAHNIFPEGGTCLEFGVFRGSSFIYQASHLDTVYRNSKLIGFDSWQGLPEEDASVWKPSVHDKGNYCSTKDVVLEKLDRLGLKDHPRLSFVDGFYHDSLTSECLDKIDDDLVFVNIDVDIFKSTIELLDFVKPRLRPGVVIYWDDWKDPRATYEKPWGEHLAWDKWSSDNPDVKTMFVEENWVNQRCTVVTEANGKTLADIGLSEGKILEINELMDSSVDKAAKAFVRSAPVSNLLKFGFQLWGRISPP